MTGNKAVFLDRDGTINVDKGYVYQRQNFEFIAGAIQAIALLNQAGFKVVVITNQSGVARGYYTEADVLALHGFIDSELAKYGARIDRYYHCPHHPAAIREEYRLDCPCRKPKSGLFRQAVAEFQVDLGLSYAIGNCLRDLAPAREIGLKSIFLVPGSRRELALQNEVTPDWIADDLLSAVKIILSPKGDFQPSC